MRDWLMTSMADRECLIAAQRVDGGWRPWRGAYARARRLARTGMLKEAGIAAMPPHVLYVVTDKGAEELKVAERLRLIKSESGK